MGAFDLQTRLTSASERWTMKCFTAYMIMPRCYRASRGPLSSPVLSRVSPDLGVLENEPIPSRH